MFDEFDDQDSPVPGAHERGRVMARAQELTGRRRLLAGLGIAVAVVLIALVVGNMRGGGPDKDVHAAAGASTTDSAQEANDTVPPSAGETPTTTGASVLGTQFSPSTTVPSSTTLPPVITGAAPKPAGPSSAGASSPGPTQPTQGTPAPRVCHNSYDPACGQFRWDPEPGPNEALTGEVTYSPATPRAGEAVTFHLVGHDPDAAPVASCNSNFGDGPMVVCDPGHAFPGYCKTQYGPWTPPAKKPGDVDTTFDHTYGQPGTYDVSIDVRSAMNDCNNPYASATTFTVKVVVAP